MVSSCYSHLKQCICSHDPVSVVSGNHGVLTELLSPSKEASADEYNGLSGL